MNVVVLMGRLTKDPEVRYTQSGKGVASFTLAVDRFGDGADFIRCQAWENQAAFCQKYLHKGSKVTLMGMIRTGSYDDRDGKKVYTTDVIANRIEFAESKKAESESGEPDQKSTPKADDDGFMPTDGFEGLPFN